MPTLAEDITALSDAMQATWDARAANRTDDRIKEQLLESFYKAALLAVADHPLDGDLEE